MAASSKTISSNKDGKVQPQYVRAQPQHVRKEGRVAEVVEEAKESAGQEMEEEKEEREGVSSGETPEGKKKWQITICHPVHLEQSRGKNTAE